MVPKILVRSSQMFQKNSDVLMFMLPAKCLFVASTIGDGMELSSSKVAFGDVSPEEFTCFFGQLVQVSFCRVIYSPEFRCRQPFGLCNTVQRQTQLSKANPKAEWAQCKGIHKRISLVREYTECVHTNQKERYLDSKVMVTRLMSVEYHGGIVLYHISTRRKKAANQG